MSKRIAAVSIYLDGPRSREFVLPDNWEDLTEEAQVELLKPVVTSLINDTVAWAVAFEEEEDA
jgi:hypothetical protein